LLFARPQLAYYYYFFKASAIVGKTGVYHHVQLFLS
jgi:hypothetical protein